MNTTDAQVVKVLTTLKLRPETELTSAQELIFKQATDEYEAYLSQIKGVFSDNEITL